MKKMLFIGLLLLMTSSAMAEMISITHQPAELRDRAMVSGSKIIRELPRYTPLELVNAGADYYQVKDVSGKTGYVHKSLTGKVPAVVVTANVCNVRTGPGTEFSIAFKAQKGQSFKILAQQQEWVQIKSNAGQTGWIWQNLVWGE